jgi:Right handed beta helix region
LLSPRSLKTILCLLTLLPLGIFIIPAHAAAATCTAAGTTGLTTDVTATSGQWVTGTIDATGCDVGVYVPPGSSGVVIANANISGANIHGIFVQDSSNVVIWGNSVVGNSGGVPAVSCDFVAPPCVAEGKAIQLVGTSNSWISNNVIKNDLFGGIAITDDGAVDPGALNPGTSSPANSNFVANNHISDVSNDCGIVIAVYNAGSANDNVVFGNTVLGDLPPFGVHPHVGQIVVAGDGPGAAISNTFIFGNTISGSTLPGIVVHSNAPGDVISNTNIWGNTINNNGYYPSFFSSPNTPVADNGTTGISIVAEAYPGMPSPPAITGTTLFSNSISADMNGIWLCKSTGTIILGQQYSTTHDVVVCASGGT